MTKRQLFTYFTIYFAISLLFACSDNKSEDNTTKSKEDSRTEILNVVRGCADIVTTEVKVRKMAIYDTSKSEKKLDITNPNTWKIGDRVCIIPVDVTIKYGYDLTEMSIDNIKISDDSTAVALFLPEPKVIDSGYDAIIDNESIVSFSTGLRDEVGHEVQEEVRRKAYEAVLKENLISEVKPEIEKNARILFQNILKSLGWNDTKIESYGK